MFVKKKVNINETIFISLGARWIFNKKIINFFKKEYLTSTDPDFLLMQEEVVSPGEL